MTYLELLKQEHPDKCGASYCYGADGCPKDYGYEEEDACPLRDPDAITAGMRCDGCWAREIPEDSPLLKKLEPIRKGKISDALKEIQKQIGKIIEIMEEKEE